MPETKPERFIGMDLRSLIILAVVVSAGGSGGALLTTMNPDLVRPDPFTGTQARELEEEMEAEHRRIRDELKLEIFKLELAIRRDMPPEPTRDRISDLEAAMIKLNPDYRPPTSRWSHLTPR